ncbi:hypothetical protein [Vibrio ulleungensis]|uniref:Transmembrane protein n=1 Tax=Vibrio ulleungensis TaxID=2807619 RepID=A0ABS2HDX9_9VIBR|nr:hypothetical protein [Vibrio ulleungensis]MBM7035800.1 hypothetical protein [Vibrio ulleungensis]
MAAQPLTRARLIQILLTMLLLIVAFVWRTVIFSDEQVNCTVQQVCNLEFEQHKLTLKWSKVGLKLQSSQNIDFSVTAIDGQPMDDTADLTEMNFTPNTKGLVLESGHQRLTINQLPQ